MIGAPPGRAASGLQLQLHCSIVGVLMMHPSRHGHAAPLRAEVTMHGSVPDCVCLCAFPCPACLRREGSEGGEGGTTPGPGEVCRPNRSLLSPIVKFVSPVTTRDACYPAKGCSLIGLRAQPRVLDSPRSQRWAGSSSQHTIHRQQTSAHSSILPHHITCTWTRNLRT